MVDESDLLIREVDEDVRHEKQMALWKKYGRYVIGSAVGIVLAVTGNTLWDVYKDQQESAASNIFSATLAAAGVDGADVTSVWADAHASLEGGYTTLAYLHEAKALQDAGDMEGALKSFDALSQSPSADADMQALGQLLAARIEMQLALLPEARGRLSLLAGDTGVWAWSAKESLATIDLMEGNLTAAYERFVDLAASTNAPQTIMVRAGKMMDRLRAAAPQMPDMSDDPQESADVITQDAPATTITPEDTGSQNTDEGNQ